MSNNLEENKERIAKRIARAGYASRRDAERMIAEGRVDLNGQKVTTPAIVVSASDVIKIDNKDLPSPERVRLWLYHKPKGLVTSHRDEKGRETVFDKLPADMGRVLSIGRLDINSEGLLLLTNDGGLKRRLELPSTRWLRQYRVRACGRVNPKAIERLKAGIKVDNTHYRPMQIRVDETGKTGANSWFTIGIREGKNREIRRALGVVGLDVNRLIRIAYGPFRLQNIESGGCKHVPLRVLKAQIDHALRF